MMQQEIVVVLALVLARRDGCLEFERTTTADEVLTTTTRTLFDFNCSYSQRISLAT
jgi:hypothetical protein